MSIIGVDIGGTKIASVLVDETGTILAEDYRMTAAEEGMRITLARINESIQSLLQLGEPVRGIGIDIPGQVDPINGIVRNAVNLGWSEVNLKAELEARLPVNLPIHIERDTYAQTLGEHVFGAGKGQNNMVYLSLGSGLGAGALIDGRLLNGAGHSALEIGHLALTGLRLPCACGNVGCAETILSGPGLVKTFQNQDWEPKVHSSLLDQADLTAQEILQAAQMGDQRAKQTIHLLGQYLGEICSDLVMILNPALIVIGGGLGLAVYEQIISLAWEEIRKRSLALNYLHLSIRKSTLNSPALGAAALVWQSNPALTEGGE